MATLYIPDEKQLLTDAVLIKRYLAEIGIGYERWNTAHSIAEDTSAEAILEAYYEEIEALKRDGGYVTADVINIVPETPNLDVMLAKFKKEHWHDEDEVRFIIAGHGVFHINPKNSAVVAIGVEAGDLLRVPTGTLHWFDLSTDRRIRAIRLFQDPTGWTPYYTESGIDSGYMPLCFGLSFIPKELQRL